MLKNDRLRKQKRGKVPQNGRFSTESNDFVEKSCKKEGLRIQRAKLEKSRKKSEKSVDKWNWFWYYVKALERAAPKNRLMTGREKHFVN